MNVLKNRVKFIKGLIMGLILFQHLHEQPLNLVKKDRKRKPSSIDGNSDVVICKLCNSYVVQSLIDTHNRYGHWSFFKRIAVFKF